MNFRLRVFASFLVLAVSFAVNPVRSPALPAAPNQSALKQSGASLLNETVCDTDALVVIDPALFEQLERAIQLVRDAGGCALHIFPPQAFIGSLTAGAEARLKEEGFRVTVFRSLVSSDQLAGLAESTAIAAAVWNRGFSPQTFDLQAQEEPPGEPLIGDQKQAELPPSLDLPAAPDGPGYYDVSEFLYGKIAVGIILPESDGSIDPSTENWSASRMDQVVSKIQSAMSWYAGTFPTANLSFYYDVHRQVPTGYEPINRSSGSDTLWIKESFDSLGYAGAWTTQAYSYLNSLRSTYKTDWALVAFVVDSNNDADGKFTDGYFGYTYGFLIVMTFDNDGWGISRMDSVMAHEMGHNFGAADEYCSVGYACCWGGGSYGYLGIANSNCEAGCDKNGNGVCDGNDVTPNSNCRNCPSCVQVSCIMRSGGLSAGMDAPSRHQIGARDSDNDGLFDPVDTKPSLTMSAFSPDPTRNLNEFLMEF